MRILHVTDCYLPRTGGLEIHVSDLAAQQRVLGHDVRVVTRTRAGPFSVDPDWVVRATSGRALPGLVGHWVPDVLHAHVSVFSPFATLAARWASRSGVPTLVTVHSMWTPLGRLPRAAVDVLDLRGSPVLWSAVSQAAARPVREALGPDADVAVLPNAIDPALWRPVRRHTHASATPTLVSVMRFTRTKRALPLARMLLGLRRSLPASVDFRAVVVGDGPQHLAFRAYARRHGMLGWLDLPGRLPRAAVRDLVATADCFVAPATLESFGIAALEARALGLPVIAAESSGVSEFVRHGREGLLVGSDAAMVSAMATVISDAGTRGLLRAHNETTPIEHDWPAACSRTDLLYARAGGLQAVGGVVTATAPGSLLVGSR